MGESLLFVQRGMPWLLYDRKGGFYFQDYTIDAESLRQLGGSYLLSAAYIDHSEDTGLELMRPEAFETENSYYRHLSLSGNG